MRFKLVNLSEIPFSIYVFLCSISLKFRHTFFGFYTFYLNIQQAIKIAILLGNSFVGNRVKTTKSYDYNRVVHFLLRMVSRFFQNRE